MRRENVRNIAIIAHVDHGKTTLVDCLLRQSGTVEGHKTLQERAMDKLDLERERGITIMSKNTALKWKGVDINVVDTPGHSDFGGEVERVLGMVDSVLLVVDAFEGPMPQTRFVLRKALHHGLRPVVVINKCDRSDARPDSVLDSVFDLFVALGASDEQLDFSVVYASARDGWAVLDLDDARDNVEPMLDAIVNIVEGPEVEKELDFQMQVATIDYDEFVGRIAVGRILRGEVSKGDTLVCLDYNGEARRGKVTRLIGFSGLQQVEIQTASAGDIIGIAGFTDALPGETVCHPNAPEALPPITVDEPTISMDFMANNGPFSGLDGKHVTSRKLRDRLYKELQSNVSLKVEDTAQADIFKVSGRGELHLGILIETMRREGYELTVSMPKVIVREEDDGTKSEPYEDVSIDCEDAYTGTVIQELNQRGGELREMRNDGDTTRLEFYIPARGLIGYRSKFLTQTRGT
ncbi:MAG: GTP-binding protein, partial [Bradymonadia bacterium]